MSFQGPRAITGKAIVAISGLKGRQLIFLTSLDKRLLCAPQKLYNFIIKPHYSFLLQT